MKKLFLALIIIAVAALASMTLFKTKPVAEKQEPVRVLPAVRVLIAEPAAETTTVRSQGLVAPKTVTNMASEVTGRILQVSEKFRVGGAFEEGELLLEIDAADYTAALATAEANLADANLALVMEQAKAEQSTRDWKKLGGGKPATDLVLRKPQLASAKARVAAAAAGVEKAGRDLDRTKIKAPYKARVRATYTDLGSFVAMGTRLADLYTTEPYEVRLPLSIEASSHADLTPGAEVVFTQAGAAEVKTWTGKILRQEGEIDRASRSLYVVAEVAPTSDTDGLQPGLFLGAKLGGEVLEKAFRIPRSAFIDGDTILLIDDENKVQFRDVQVARLDGKDALVSGGIEPGERICTTSLAAPVAGLDVEIQK